MEVFLAGFKGFNFRECFFRLFTLSGKQPEKANMLHPQKR